MIFNGNKKLKEENELLKSQVQILQKEKEELQKQVQLLKEKNEKLQITASEKRVTSTDSAKERDGNLISSDALEQYRFELNRLKIFVENWLNALPEPKERTPETRKRMALALALSEILKDNSCPESLDEGVEILEKLTNVINGGGAQSSGFNLDEVLNPSGELDLATLCKELGVMD